MKANMACTTTKKRPKRRARTAGLGMGRTDEVSGGGGGAFVKQTNTNSAGAAASLFGVAAVAAAMIARPATSVKMKKSDVRFGNKEGGGTHFGSEERFAWQKARYVSDAMYSMPAVKAPPFSFGTSTRADWKKIMENTKDLHNPNGEYSSE